MAANPRHIAVVALRRSGTTALWRMLRQDTRYTCFDEPFSPLLENLPADNQKNTRAELIALYNRDPERFREIYAPIPRAEEVTRHLSGEQADYLGYLLADGPAAFDVTRCMGKVPALHKVAPEAVLIHLFRHPVAFASSHLLPSDSFDPFGLRKKRNRKTALTRTRRFNGWGMEELTRGAHFESASALLSRVDVKLPDPSENISAFVRLLAIWLGAYRLAERDGRACFGNQFISIPFEDFCRTPSQYVGKIHDLAGIDRVELGNSWLKPASEGIAPTASEWADGAEAVGFDSDEMARFFSDRAAK